MATLGVLALATWRLAGPWPVSFLYLLSALFFSSTAHPWYLLWALALLPVALGRGEQPTSRRARALLAGALAAAWVWSLTIAWSYAVLIDPPRWYLPDGVVLAEYVPVYAVLVGVVAWACRGRGQGGPSPGS
jgi:hypothetical protein